MREKPFLTPTTILSLTKQFWLDSIFYKHFLSSMLEICMGKEGKPVPWWCCTTARHCLSICSDLMASSLWGSEHNKEEQEIKLWSCLTATNLQCHLNTPWEVCCIPQRAEMSHCWKVLRTHGLQVVSVLESQTPRIWAWDITDRKSVLLLCHLQYSCDFALMADAKVNWDIYTYLYMYFLCQSRWD